MRTAPDFPTAVDWAKAGQASMVKCPEWVWSRIEVTGFCWLWRGNVNDSGYGRVRVDGTLHRAHRFIYQVLVEPLPPALHLDHLCRVTICVNPDHLEPVTPKVNNARSYSPTAINARKTECPSGHPYNEETIRVDAKGMKHCRPCDARRARERRAERRAA